MMPPPYSEQIDKMTITSWREYLLFYCNDGSATTWPTEQKFDTIYDNCEQRIPTEWNCIILKPLSVQPLAQRCSRNRPRLMILTVPGTLVLLLYLRWGIW